MKVLYKIKIKFLLIFIIINIYLIFIINYSHFKIAICSKQLNLDNIKDKYINDYKKLNNTKRKNLIIGVVANYNWTIIESFFKSYNKAKFENCECIMFVGNMSQETINKIQSFRVKIREIPKVLLNISLINYRWKIYGDYLNNNQGKYNLVFTTDLRDTIFQRDVFKFYDSRKSFLGISIEDGILSNEPTNKIWLINA